MTGTAKRMVMAVVVGVLSISASTAWAEHGSWGRTSGSCQPTYSRPSYGGYGSSSYGGYGSSSYGGYGSSSYGGYRSTPRPTYHDTTHLDYHPAEVTRHRNHYDVQPSHYDLHRTGHWHR